MSESIERLRAALARADAIRIAAEALSDDDFDSAVPIPRDDWDLIRACLTEQEAELGRLREDCGEAYQVVGYMLGISGHGFTDDDVERALDNLSAAANGEPRPHDDLLPWPRPSDDAARAATREGE